MDKKLLFITGLLLTCNAWASYTALDNGESVKVNDWVLLEEITTKDKKSNLLEMVYKFCVISEIVDERNKTPSAYATKNKPHPLNAVGFAWFIVNGTPVQSFTTRYIFRDALTGRRDTTLPEGCEIKLQFE